MFGYAVAGYPLIWYWHSIIHHRQSKRIFKKNSGILAPAPPAVLAGAAPNTLGYCRLHQRPR
ncbi:hypothetical protein PVAP13_3KG129127 [Panicum virgatum]|uniref:Uncharacterized protein n=1 Tax=Panicum virgatum TaxID=38727 RepID=A0A8T0UQT7_PANVG|nr:hypothetical protein PVAP13_3KG129127 [Panicum virgatum]